MNPLERLCYYKLRPGGAQPAGFGFYGTVNDQASETAEWTSMLYMTPFSGSMEKRIADILARRVPVFWDMDEWLWQNSADHTRYVLLPDALVRLRACVARLQQTGAWQYVYAVLPRDEPLPRTPEEESDVLRSMELLKTVCPDKKLACTFTSKNKLLGLDMLDIVGVDRYSIGNRFVMRKPWRWGKFGYANRIQRKMRADQQLLLFPGAYETPSEKFRPANPEKWFAYAQRQKRPVWLCCFIYDYGRDDEHRGLRSMPSLKQRYQTLYNAVELPRNSR